MRRFTAFEALENQRRGVNPVLVILASEVDVEIAKMNADFQDALANDEAVATDLRRKNTEIAALREEQVALTESNAAFQCALTARDAEIERLRTALDKALDEVDAAMDLTP